MPFQVGEERDHIFWGITERILPQCFPYVFCCGALSYVVLGSTLLLLRFYTTFHYRALFSVPYSFAKLQPSGLKFSEADVCLGLRSFGKFICQSGSSFLYHSNLTHREDSPKSKHKNIDGKHLSLFYVWARKLDRNGILSAIGTQRPDPECSEFIRKLSHESGPDF